MKKAKEWTAIYAVGAVGYSIIEILWRGVTHWSMSLTGGFCFLTFHITSGRCQKMRLLKKCGIGCLLFTLTELLVGLIVNKRLSWNVWDYSNYPLNVKGQICAQYCGLWFLLCIPLTFVSNRLRRVFVKKMA